MGNKDKLLELLLFYPSNKWVLIVFILQLNKWQGKHISLLAKYLNSKSIRSWLWSIEARGVNIKLVPINCTTILLYQMKSKFGFQKEIYQIYRHSRISLLIGLKFKLRYFSLQCSTEVRKFNMVKVKIFNNNWCQKIKQVGNMALTIFYQKSINK